MIEPLSLLAALGIGLFGSTHCLVMCGGIAAAIGSKNSQNPASAAIAFNIGRISTYVLAGALVAGLGMWIQSFHETLMLFLRTLAGVLLILMGLYIGRWFNLLTRVEAAGQILWRHVQPYTRTLMSKSGLLNRYLLGLAWGLLPCGLIYTTLSWVAANGNIGAGALGMLFFGLGTLPALFATSLAATSLGKLLNQSITQKISGFLLISYGIGTLVAVWLP